MTHDAHPWDALVSAALLGAARRPVDPAALPGAVGAVGARLPETDPAARLLDAAALLTVARRAGLVPRAVAVEPAPTSSARPAPASPPETLPCVPRAAAARLDDLLSGRREDSDTLLVQWLHATARHGLRVPVEHLPALLDWAARTKLHADVLPVLGARGRWLAAHRRPWLRTLEHDHHVDIDIDTDDADRTGASTWTHGTPAERRAWFAALRRADPAAARAALLELDWNRQDADSRLAFVESLSRGLCVEDEEILDRALADRRKDVRLLAAHLHAQVPGGRFQAQASARALACVRVEHPPRPSLVARRPGPRIVVTLPDAADTSPWQPEMLSTPRGTGDRAWLLRHLVQATPLQLWSESTGLSPETLVSMPVADDLAPALHAGWARAAVRESDTVWARLLAPTQDDSTHLGLLRLLPDTERVDLVIATLAADSVDVPAGRSADAVLADAGTRATDIRSALVSLGDTWPDPIIEPVLRWLVASPAPAWEHGGVARLAASALPAAPSAEARARAVATSLPPDHARTQTLLSLADTLLYRRQMIEELQ